MEKILKNIFTIICVLAMTVSFTSCDGGNSEPDTFYYYKADGNMSSVSTSMDALDALFAIPEYNEAIAKLFAGNNYVLGNHDSDVIEVCDEVYKRHQEKHSSWVGLISISRNQYDSKGNLLESITIKEYKYESKK